MAKRWLRHLDGFLRPPVGVQEPAETLQRICIGLSDDKRFLYRFPSLFRLTPELQNFCGKQMRPRLVKAGRNDTLGNASHYRQIPLAVLIPDTPTLIIVICQFGMRVRMRD